LSVVTPNLGSGSIGEMGYIVTATGTRDGAVDTSHLLAQVRELYGRIAYTHKTHEKQADLFERKDRRQRRIRVVLTAVSSGAFLASVLGLLLDEKWAAVATSFIAVLLSASSLADKTFRYGEEMQQHRAAAVALWDLRESYLSLIVTIKSGESDISAIERRRDELQSRAAAVLADAPRTSSLAYSAAQAALQSNEELTFSETEVDHLLPVHLRQNKGAAE